jgi:ABC-2 type transport system permease protein
MDVLGQAFFRGIYGFQGLVRSGGFDYILSKPVSPLFYCLTRSTDVLDLLFLIPIIALIAFTITKVPIAVSAAHILLYVLFIILGMIIVLGLHIITACISIRTLESENVIWLYRETMTLGRFPPEIFSPFIQAIFTFVFPIIIIVAFPTKILLGLLQWHWILFTIIYTVIFFTISLWLWDNSLKHYSSASS